MKLFAMVWVRALFADSASAKKINVAAHARSLTSDNPCPGGATNRYPDALPTSFTFGETTGLSPLDAVWDTEALRAALGKDSEWTIGQPWLLSAKFTSDSTVDRTFGFSGGGQGFLSITVPAGTQEERIEAKGTVLSVADHTEFQYRAPNNFTSGAITMTDICLVPQTCDGYACPSSMKLKGADIYGRSDQRCCEFRKCVDETVTCIPRTQYKARSDFTTKIGHTKAHCCDSIFCPSNFCENMTKWTDRSGSGVLGSTKEECCEPKECESYACSDPSLWTKLPPKMADNSTRYGWSDEECCDPRYCNLYDCQPNNTYTHVANASAILGSSRDDCCVIMNCTEFVCPDSTKWKKKGNETPGNSVEQCCEKTWCSAHRCSGDKLQLKVSSSQRQGSTDDECCEQKFCKDYTCSDATKWQKRSNQYSSNNTDRRGFSDEECCDSKICIPEICDPATQWVPTQASNVQGSTLEQCCTPIYCSQYVCDTDLDGDGKGTQWLKKVDTNTFKWQGSTNEECCLPIYCSQYTTSNVTRWKRKTDSSLKGSTDAECYDERLCSDYCCVDDSKVLRANAEKHQGSTDAECCVPASG